MAPITSMVVPIKSWKPMCLVSCRCHILPQKNIFKIQPDPVWKPKVSTKIRQPEYHSFYIIVDFFREEM